MYGLRNMRSLAGARGLLSNLHRGIGRRRLGHSHLTPQMPHNRGNKKIEDIKERQSNEALKAELKSYSKIAMSASEKLTELGSKLVTEGSLSIFETAKKTGMVSNIVKKATDFINNYNNTISSMTKLGGKENLEMISKLKEYAKANEAEFAKAGITVLKDGSLRIDPNKLKDTDLETLKKLFNGKDSFGGKVTELGTKIKANVEKKLEENLKILGGDKDWYGKSNRKSPLTRRELLESISGRHINRKI